MIKRGRISFQDTNTETEYHYPTTLYELSSDFSSRLAEKAQRRSKLAKKKKEKQNLNSDE